MRLSFAFGVAGVGVFFCVWKERVGIEVGTCVDAGRKVDGLGWRDLGSVGTGADVKMGTGARDMV